MSNKTTNKTLQENEEIMSKVCEFMDTSTTSSLTLINLVAGVVGSNIEDFIALYSTNKDFVLGEEFGVDVLLFKGGVMAHITNYSTIEIKIDDAATGSIAHTPKSYGDVTTLMLKWSELYNLMGFEYHADEEGV